MQPKNEFVKENAYKLTMKKQIERWYNNSEHEVVVNCVTINNLASQVNEEIIYELFTKGNLKIFYV